MSEETNTHGKPKPVYRVGQGATDAPTKWTFTDNVIMKAFNKNAIGCIMVDPTGTVKNRQN
eukprot:9363323-Ditylum_brightwellii.AAC.1